MADWEAVKEEPAASQWQVVKEEPPKGALAKAAELADNPLIPISGAQRAGELVGQGAQSVARGVKGMASADPYNYWYRQPLADVVGGIGTIAGAPAGLVSPYAAKLGIPKEVTEAVLPYVIPGIPKTGRAVAAGEEAAGAAARAAPKVATSPQAKLIEDITERASLKPASKREAFLKEEMQALLDDADKRKQFTPEQVEKIKQIAHGGIGKDLLNMTGELTGHILGGSTGRVIGKLTGSSISRRMTERQLSELKKLVGSTEQAPQASIPRREVIVRPDGSVGLGAFAPLERDVIRRGRSGRPIETKGIAIGSEGQILEQGGSRLVGSQPEREAFLRSQWDMHGPDLDYEDIWQSKKGEQIWRNEIDRWNRDHGDNLSYEGDLSPHRRSGFMAHFDEKYLARKKAAFPGAKKANEYFESSDAPYRASYIVPVSPLERSIIRRGRGGRPIETATLATGKEGEVLEAGARRVAATAPEDRAMRATMKAAMPSLPQAETDQILDAAVAAIKEYGSAEAAAANTTIANPVWERAFKAALQGASK